ncbi:MAG: response regulator [Candidatus Nealsonbacteria bacterium CG_4_10_14_0_2_um_filter_38_17]|uniref:Response regulator n=2 Tax=Candidatus Nealsoniibacteriota TaxID=1817911 RepID=A0A2M7UYH7_9BACT|nr:MAG: response regulator [Candidatus Nealsonbacteria bacterium CG23_combo_of_CG06-09_8_20_14_all_38_19]PIZ89041.1 MAG: response regulator [Candidatus Nealsonbacteria bacterium CG_4_10_14_0_2_um_filter_38_17]
MEGKNQKILMMEEDRFLRKIYRNKMNLAGFDFVEATNGLEGLNKVTSEKPDLVLLDVILSRKSGFDVLIEMRKNPETRETPVIILSNLSQESDIKKGLSLGAQEYLVKSEVSLSDVVEKTKELLGRTRV